MSTVSRLRAVLVAIAVAAAMVAATPANAQGTNQATEAETVTNDVMFATSEEVREYIQVTEDFDGQYSPHIVPAAAFSSDGFDPDSSFFSFFGGHLRGTAANDGCVKAPLQLPDNATIVNLFGYMYDNSGQDVTLHLRRKRNGTTDTSETLAFVTTAGASENVQIPGDTTVVEPVVNNGDYSYFLTACFANSNLRIHGAWIFVEPADDTFTVSGTDAQIEVLPTGATANRTLVNLVNFGRSRFRIQDVTQNNGWLFGTRGGGFEINRAGSGGTEMRFFEDGRVIMGAGPATTFDLKSNGDVVITGTLTENSALGSKTAISPVDPHAVLAAVEGLDISTWQYRSSPVGVRHMGPMAEDFYAAFGLAGNDQGISSLDASGVALSSIQALSERNVDLESRVADLEGRVAELEVMVAELLDG